MRLKQASKRTTKRLKLTVQFGRGVRIAPLTHGRLRALIQASLESDFCMTLRFATRAQALALNQQFRDGDYVPNVLTFSYAPEPAADLVICTPIVRSQARALGRSFDQHLAHMLVHGTLHAQGYTHEKPRQAARMEALERTILADFGIADPYL